jgi:hypothetical protein
MGCCLFDLNISGNNIIIQPLICACLLGCCLFGLGYIIENKSKWEQLYGPKMKVGIIHKRTPCQEPCLVAKHVICRNTVLAVSVVRSRGVSSPVSAAGCVHPLNEAVCSQLICNQLISYVCNM